MLRPLCLLLLMLSCLPQLAWAQAAPEEAEWRATPEGLAAFRAGDFQVARKFLDVDVEACSKASPDGRRCVFVLMLQAAASYGVPGAVQRIDRAIAAAERAYGADGLEIALVLATTAPVAIAASDYAKSEAMLVRAISIRTRHYGPLDPRVLDLQASLPMLYGMQGRVDEARNAADAVIAAARQSSALTPDRVAALTVSVSFVISAYDPERGTALLTDAVALLTATRPETDIELIDAQFKLAGLRAASDRTFARAIFERALAAARRSKAAPPQLVGYLDRIAAFERRDRNYDRALAYLDEADALARRHPEWPMIRLGILQERMMVYLAMERADLAEPIGRQLVALAEGAMGGANGFAAKMFRVYLASIYRDRGRYKDVERLFDDHLIAMLRAAPPQDPISAISFGILGEAKLKLGKLPAARVWLRDAGERALRSIAVRREFDTKAQSDMRDLAPVFRTQVQVAWRLARPNR